MSGSGRAFARDALRFQRADAALWAERLRRARVFQDTGRNWQGLTFDEWKAAR